MVNNNNKKVQIPYSRNNWLDEAESVHHRHRLHGLQLQEEEGQPYQLDSAHLRLILR